VFVLDWAPLFVTLGILYPVAAMARYIVLEKQTRQKEMMKMMGVQEADIGWSWYITFLMFHVFTAVGAGAMTKLLYSNSSLVILMIFWLFTFAALISLSFFLAAFFTQATRATLVVLLIFFGGYFLTLVVDFQHDPSSSIMAVSLHPAGAFAYGMQEIGRLEDLGVGLQMDTVTETDSASGFTFGHTLSILLVDSVLYGILGWYANRVVPSAFGRPLPLHFPFTMSYWFPRSIRAPPVDEDIPPNAAVHLEPVSTFLKDQAKEGKSIEIRNIRKSFREKIAVDGLSLSMYNGQITALLGHNGAGKTTTLNMLTGMTAPSAGHAVVAGKDIRTQMAEIRHDIGICLQHDCLFHNLTVKEHIQFFSMIKGVYAEATRKEAEEKITACIQDVALWEKRNTFSKNLSGGMKRKLSVAIAFCGDSKTVLLDEPTSGMVRICASNGTGLLSVRLLTC
jgi:ABC-type Na+ transport system ATPase subunit NatA